MPDEELKKIIKDNKELLTNLDDRLKRIEKRFIWSSVFGFIKVLIIIAPIIIGLIYITPFLKDFLEIYKPVYEVLPNIFQNTSGQSANNVSGDTSLMIDSFCDPQTRQNIIDQFCK